MGRRCIDTDTFKPDHHTWAWFARVRVSRLFGISLSCCFVLFVLQRAPASFRQYRTLQVQGQSCTFSVNSTRRIATSSPYAIMNRDIFYHTHWLINYKQKYIACLPPRAGCSNWIRYLRLAEGNRTGFSKTAEKYNSNINILHDHREIFDLGISFLNPERLGEIQYALNNPEFFKFAFVRHPVDRLISVYAKQFLDDCERRIKEGSGPSGSTCTVDQSRLQDKPIGFGTYVRSLQNQPRSSLNEHIRPLFDLCFLDKVNFDFVGDIHSVSDTDYVSGKLGFSTTYSEFSEYLVKTKNCTSCHRGLRKAINGPCINDFYDQAFNSSHELLLLSLEEIGMLNKFTSDDLRWLGYRKPPIEAQRA